MCNLYFLVEGKRTERVVYPAWLSILRPELSRVESCRNVQENNYVLISAEGYPSILDEHLRNAISDYNNNQLFTHFILCLDSEMRTVFDVQKEVRSTLENPKCKLRHGEFILVVQHRCIETWFLGNSDFIKRNPSDAMLVEFKRHYDVRMNDPEAMPRYRKYSTHAQFHEQYFRAAAREHRLHFSKANAGPVLTEDFFRGLLRRVQDHRSHLKSFQTFLEFSQSLAIE